MHKEFIQTTFKELIPLYDHFLFDCDGVLWEGTHVMTYARECVNHLKALQKSLAFISNTSGRSRVQAAAKFNLLGFDSVLPSEVYFTSYATAKYIKAKYPSIHKVYLIGMPGFLEELTGVGIECIQTSVDTPNRIYNVDKFPELKVDPTIDAVVVGIDLNIDFQKICYASILLQMEKKFLASNPDAYDPMPEGIFPGNGAIVEALTVASGKRAEIVGKPHTAQVEVYMQDKGLKEEDKKRMLIIGDRLDTDITLGKNAGVDTALVLTGVAKMGDVEAAGKEGKAVPKYILNSLQI